MARIVKPLVCIAGLGLAACGFAQPVQSPPPVVKPLLVQPRLQVQPPVVKPLLVQPPQLVVGDANGFFAFQQLANADALIRQVEQQFGPQLRQICRSELHLLRLVCQPTKQQFEKIAGDGSGPPEAVLQQVAQMWRGGSSFDPRTTITSALAKAARQHLSPEQAAKYQMELDQRAAATRQMTLANLISRVDQVLFLTAEQRTKLTTILENNWDEAWSNPIWIGSTDLGWPPVWPPMPDAPIYAILTETQSTLWRTTPARTTRYGFGFNMESIPDITIPDEVWPDDPPKSQTADKDKGLPKVGGKK